MSANKIAETSTSTGTGNITLAGAWSVPASFITGNRTFNSFYGLNHYFPYMIQDQSGNWEKGIGYLSDSTTLVRETVVDNSLSTTALIDFPPGDKLVMVQTDAGYGVSQVKSSSGIILSSGVTGVATNALNRSPGSVMFSPFIIERPLNVTELQINVTSAASSGVYCRAGIYSVGEFSLSSSKFRLVSGTGTALLDSTGLKNISVPAKLGAGTYMIGFAVSGNYSARMFNLNKDTGIRAEIGGNTSQAVHASFTNPHLALPTDYSGAVTQINITNFTLECGLFGVYL